MASEEKAQAERALAQRQADLERQREERNALQQQMADVQSKLMVGGVNLVDKAQEQQTLLDDAQQELEARLKVSTPQLARLGCPHPVCGTRTKNALHKLLIT